MKKLIEYIQECIDSENLAWKIEVYFKRKKDAQYNSFIKIVKKFAETHQITDEDLKDTKFDLKKFIYFMCEDIEDEQPRDYKYLLQKLLSNVLDDKTIQL